MSRCSRCCVPAVLLLISIAQAQQKMYWTDSNTHKIQRANLDGSSVEDLIATGLGSPQAIALDVSAGKMYWTDAGTKKVQRANLDGSQIQGLVTTGLGNPFGIALDLTAGKVYWTDVTSPGKIQRANLDGTSVQTLLMTGNNSLGDIALDVTAGKMYWTDYGVTDMIQRANLNGSGVEVVLTGFSFLFTITLDVAAGQMYWSDTGSDKIERATLNGAGRQTLVTGVNAPGIALDTGAGKMYWTDRDLDKIRRANLDGSGVEDLVTTGLSWPRGIALDLSASLPEQPINPSPPAGSTDVPVHDDLTWSDGGGATSFDVYFGTNPMPGPSEFQASQAGTSFDLAILSPSTTYYWRIDAVNDQGTTTGTVWSFQTAASWVYNEQTGSSYLVGSAGTWQAAEAEAVSLGGHLVTINDADEDTWLVATFGTSEYYWIGFTDEQIEGTWQWISGKPPSYTNWAIGQPDNQGPTGQDYAIMNYAFQIGWDDRRDDEMGPNGLPFALIERSGPPPSEQPQPGQYTPTEIPNIDRLWQWDDNLGRFVDPGGSIFIVEEWPTYILTHGWEGNLGGSSCDPPDTYARASIGCAIRQELPQSNILAWEWSENANPNNDCDVAQAEAAFSTLIDCVGSYPPEDWNQCLWEIVRAGGQAGAALMDAYRAGLRAKDEGQALGQKLADLLSQGSLGSELHLIGHSHGGGLLARAAQELSASPADSLTVLDTPQLGPINTLKHVIPGSVGHAANFYYPDSCFGFGELAASGGTNVLLSSTHSGNCGGFPVCHTWIAGCDAACTPATPVGWYPGAILSDPSFDSTNMGSILNVSQFPLGYFEESGATPYQFNTSGRGACCSPYPGICVIVTEAECQANPPWVFKGVNTNCSECSTASDRGAGPPPDDELAGMTMVICELFESASSWTAANSAVVTNVDPIDPANVVVLMSESGDASFFKTIDWPAPVLLMTFDYMFREPRGGEALTVYVNDEIVNYDAAEASLATGALTGSGSVYVGNVAGTTANIAFVLSTDGTAGGSVIVDNLKIWAVAGDFVLDGRPDLNDVPAFVDALLGQSATPALALVGDMNRNGATDGGDMQAFLDAVLSP